MTTVSLAGRLGEIVGANFSFKTRTLREVLAAIESNTGRLRSYFGNNGKRRFAIFINGKESQNILDNWDESFYNERYNKLYAEYDKAKRTYFKESESKAVA